MVLRWRRTKKAITRVAALVFVFNLTMQALRRGTVPPAAEKPVTAPLRPTVAEASQTAFHTCRRDPSPSGDLFLLDFPGKGNCASRSGTGSVGAELQISSDGHPPEPGAQGTMHLGPESPDEFIKFTVAHHAKLIAAMEEMTAEHESDMEKIKSNMEKIISGLRRHAREFEDLKDEVARQGTIQRLVIWAVLVSTIAFGFFVWKNYDEWMKSLGDLVMVWAGEALYEFTGGWFGRR